MIRVFRTFPYPARRVSDWLDTASDPMLAVQSDPRPLFVMIVPHHGVKN